MSAPLPHLEMCRICAEPVAEVGMEFCADCAPVFVGEEQARLVCDVSGDEP